MDSSSSFWMMGLLVEKSMASVADFMSDMLSMML